MTPTDLTAELLSAIEANDIVATTRMLNAGADANANTGITKRCMLDNAIRAGASIDIIRLLLDHGASPSPAKPELASPLIRAAEIGAGEVCAELIARGASVNYATAAGGTALQAAALHHHLDVCRLLMDAGADPNQMDSMDNTPLHNVAKAGAIPESLEIVRLLIARGALPNYAPDSRGPLYLTPFQDAVVLANEPLVRLYVEEFNEDPRQITLSGLAMGDIAGSETVRQFLYAMAVEKALEMSLNPSPTGTTDAAIRAKSSRSVDLL